MKKITSILTVIIMLCSLSSTVFADSVLDLTMRGSIQITMRYGDTYVPGGSLTLYKVGDIYEENGNYSFVLNDRFSSSNQTLEDIQSPALAEKLANYAQENAIVGTSNEIDQNANISFTDLDLGLYLLVQDVAADGYSKVSPFLVCVPMQENGYYVYDVDASPKVELQPSTDPDDPDTPDTPDIPDNPDTPDVPDTPNTPGTPEKLPQTGQLNWPIPVLVVCGLGLFIIGWWMRFGRKKDSYEK